MSGRISVCSICPRENEQIDAVVRIEKENRSAIYGTVIDEDGNPVADAVVKLLQLCPKKCKGLVPVPLTHTFTDEYGQFLLGPLCPNRRYMLKIYKDNISIRYEQLESSCYRGRCIGSNCGKHGYEEDC